MDLQTMVDTLQEVRDLEVLARRSVGEPRAKESQKGFSEWPLPCVSSSAPAAPLGHQEVSCVSCI